MAQPAPAPAPQPAPVAQPAPMAQPAPAPAPQPAPATQSTRDLASTDFTGGVSTKVPLDVTAEGKESLVHTAKNAASAVNDAKPMHGNLWF
ncbi:hypothetical protein [Streptomyces tibetensis]|uniref:Uncharacterized protein n=1 Tax=Streptomyces tibetensis TaxID=2382123 RepID=A0ABW6MSM1_9ACTN